MGFPGGMLVTIPVNQLASAGDIKEAALIPGSGWLPRGGHGNNSLQYSCLENAMDKEDWWATVHRVTKYGKQLKQLSTHVYTHTHMHTHTHTHIYI